DAHRPEPCTYRAPAPRSRWRARRQRRTRGAGPGSLSFRRLRIKVTLGHDELCCAASYTCCDPLADSRYVWIWGEQGRRDKAGERTKSRARGCLALKPLAISWL